MCCLYRDSDPPLDLPSSKHPLAPNLRPNPPPVDDSTVAAVARSWQTPALPGSGVGVACLETVATPCLTPHFGGTVPRTPVEL